MLDRCQGIREIVLCGPFGLPVKEIVTRLHQRLPPVVARRPLSHAETVLGSATRLDQLRLCELRFQA
jgi:hypothetical protein